MALVKLLLASMLATDKPSHLALMPVMGLTVLHKLASVAHAGVSAGIAGVYDIETHYQYEYGRGVAELSTMKRAMGGHHKFQSQSPALILNAASGCKARVRLPDQATGGTVETSPGSRYAAVMCMRRLVQSRCSQGAIRTEVGRKTIVLSC